MLDVVSKGHFMGIPEGFHSSRDCDADFMSIFYPDLASSQQKLLLYRAASGVSTQSSHQLSVYPKDEVTESLVLRETDIVTIVEISPLHTVLSIKFKRGPRIRS